MSSLPQSVIDAEPGVRVPVRLLGTGSFLPERVVSNAELAAGLGVDAEWIERRTGLRERRVAAEGQATSDLATAAARRALEAAGVAAGELDLVVCATCSPDHAFPSTAALVAQQLGATGCAAFDLQAGCAGFVYALSVAAQQVHGGLARRVLVIGADLMTRHVDPHDRDTAVIFGDGAGAAVLGPGEAGQGLEALDLGADGSGAGLLSLPAGGSRRPASADTVAGGLHRVRMEGRALFRAAVRCTVESARRALAAAKLVAEDVDLVVPHQSSRRLLAATARSLGLPLERFVVNLERFGNTSAGSLPIALDEAVRDGRAAPGHRLLLLGFGAGLSWGSALLRI